MKLAQRLGLAWRILRQKPGDLMAHADRELSPVSYGDQELREMILVFSTHGYSGSSAAWAISTLEKLLRFEPLGPLTGEDDEWNYAGNGLFQNKRCSRVFKQADRFNGQAYDIEAVVYRNRHTGVSYTGSNSHRLITFPYTPTTKFIDVPN